MEALHAIWEPLLKKVTEAVETADRPLWVTGHSLGGALALLAAWRLQRSFVTVHEVVTFGAPMIGNDAAAKAFEQEFAGKIFRYVNLEDPVPLLPSVSLVANSYAHCQNEVSMKAVQAAVSAIEELKQTAGSAVDRLIEATQIDLRLEGRPGPDRGPLHRPLPGAGQGEVRPRGPAGRRRRGQAESGRGPASRGVIQFRPSEQSISMCSAASAPAPAGHVRRDAAVRVLGPPSEPIRLPGPVAVPPVPLFLGQEGPESMLRGCSAVRHGVDGLVTSTAFWLRTPGKLPAEVQ